MPVASAIDKFGLENFSRDTANLFKKEPFEELELVHVVRPRSIYDENKLDKKNTIASYRTANLEIVKTSYPDLKKPNLFEQYAQTVYQPNEEEFL